jgi:hypothetical protein
LFTDLPDYHFDYVGLYFVDYTTGYSLTVYGPKASQSGGGGPTDPSLDDPRGEPISIHGIGLDNLRAVFNGSMQIINSVSITRR